MDDRREIFRDRAVLSRPDGDVTKEVTGYFDPWRAFLKTAAYHLDKRPHARLFLRGEEVPPHRGDHIQAREATWRVGEVQRIAGPAAELWAVELILTGDTPPAKTPDLAWESGMDPCAPTGCASSSGE